MLTELRSALAMAQGLQADVNRITAATPHRSAKPWRTYRFCSTVFDWRPRLELECGYSRPRVYQPTLATYNRFAALANSGNYIVEIMHSDHGVAWQLRRK